MFEAEEGKHSADTAACMLALAADDNLADKQELHTLFLHVSPQHCVAFLHYMSINVSLWKLIRCCGRQVK